MHVLLLLLQIVLNTYDFEWQKFVQPEEGKTRMKEIRVFETRKYFKQVNFGCERFVWRFYLGTISEQMSTNCKARKR